MAAQLLIFYLFTFTQEFLPSLSMHFKAVVSEHADH